MRATTVSRRTWRLRPEARHARPGADHPRGSRSATALASAFSQEQRWHRAPATAFRSTRFHYIVCLNSTSPVRAVAPQHRTRSQRKSGLCILVGRSFLLGAARTTPHTPLLPFHYPRPQLG